MSKSHSLNVIKFIFNGELFSSSKRYNTTQEHQHKHNCVGRFKRASRTFILIVFFFSRALGCEILLTL